MWVVASSFYFLYINILVWITCVYGSFSIRSAVSFCAALCTYSINMWITWIRYLVSIKCLLDKCLRILFEKLYRSNKKIQTHNKGKNYITFCVKITHVDCLNNFLMTLVSIFNKPIMRS